ncbi:hypothetical protein JI752_018740 [Lysobacter sp. MMG2]|uniref:hypothetical protein n=1 Tax=Lysobacter sp. MMG2 TaxID=2801338 RepID=UPI001C222665|nr:hypothetical protein [Lysobacter sp. MMG2]MBU8978190.1 hypothetical protein [Lysobacter sp. MMG2]
MLKRNYPAPKVGKSYALHTQARSEPARLNVSVTRQTLLNIESAEPSDQMMAKIRSVVDQSRVADESI